ncbi:MAG: type 4a pilus biogenesis protein PilO [Bdellovibrionales bacterium]
MSALAKFGDMPLSRVLIIAIVLAGLYYLVGYDTGETFKNATVAALQAKDDLGKEMVKIDRELDEINQLKAAQERDSERLNVLLGYIPERLTKTELMRTLGNEAKSVGVSINQIRDNSGVGKKSEFYEEVGVDVDLAGNFSQLMLFMANLTKLNQILSVETLELRSQGTGDADSLTMSSSIRGYRYTPKSQPGAAQ